MENKETPVIDIIRKRVSCRTYNAKPIEAHKIDQLKAFLQSNLTGPFGSVLRFELLDLNEVEKAEVRKLGTYGVIRGGRYYIVGAAVQDSSYDFVGTHGGFYRGPKDGICGRVCWPSLRTYQGDQTCSPNCGRYGGRSCRYSYTENSGKHHSEINKRSLRARRFTEPLSS